MTPGALTGDEYCQISAKVTMPECNGCPAFERRIELYTDTDRGCGDEFSIPAPTTDPVEPVTPTPDPTTTDPVEPTGAAYLATISLAAVAISLY